MPGKADKFARLAALRPALRCDQEAQGCTLRDPSDEDRLARLIGAGVGRNRYGNHLTVKKWFPTPEFASPTKEAIDLLSRTRNKPLSHRARIAFENPDNWLFLDTETTGISGGTGTYAFLIGLAWWDAGGLQVEQLIMRDFTEEYSLLQELASRLADRPVLVTFNGKSFDWPLLESRFTMTRAIKTPQLAAHLDLLHPARAVWKFRLGSVRLIDLERQVLDAPRLGWRREKDVESALIPQFYFDYLRGGAAEPLAGVVLHNQMDLRGLAALSGKMNEVLTVNLAHQADLEGPDLFGLSRYLQRRGEMVRAGEVCARALDRGLPAEHRSRAKKDLAQLAKRGGDLPRAVECWQALLSDPDSCIHACEQLASYYERHAKDFKLAEEACELALSRLERTKWRTRNLVEIARISQIEERLLRRLNRLRRRMKSSPVLPLAADNSVRAPSRT